MGGGGGGEGAPSGDTDGCHHEKGRGGGSAPGGDTGGVAVTTGRGERRRGTRPAETLIGWLSPRDGERRGVGALRRHWWGDCHHGKGGEEERDPLGGDTGGVAVTTGRGGGRGDPPGGDTNGVAVTTGSGGGGGGGGGSA